MQARVWNQVEPPLVPFDVVPLEHLTDAEIRGLDVKVSFDVAVPTLDLEPELEGIRDEVPGDIQTTRVEVVEDIARGDVEGQRRWWAGRPRPRSRPAPHHLEKHVRLGERAERTRSEQHAMGVTPPQG